MNVAKELYELQEIDLELDTRAQALSQARARLGESQTVLDARNRLDGENKRVEELGAEQHSLEWEIEDITTKIDKAQEELYSGRVKNPKELANLQHEIEVLKPKRSGLEDRAIDIIEQIEQATTNVSELKSELAGLEAEWQKEQRELAAQIKDLEAEIADLKEKRTAKSGQFDADTLEFYSDLRSQKGTAVAAVEQGICRGCRLSLSNAELQKARSGGLMQCSSCGRILCLI